MLRIPLSNSILQHGAAAADRAMIAVRQQRNARPGLLGGGPGAGAVRFEMSIASRASHGYAQNGREPPGALDVDAIPFELRERDQWVAWQLKRRRAKPT